MKKNIFVACFAAVAVLLMADSTVKIEIPYETAEYIVKTSFPDGNSKEKKKKTRYITQKMTVKGQMVMIESAKGTKAVLGGYKIIMRDGYIYEFDETKRTGKKYRFKNPLYRNETMAAIPAGTTTIKKGKGKINGVNCDIFEYESIKTMFYIDEKYLNTDWRNKDGFLMKKAETSESKYGKNIKIIEVFNLKKNHKIDDYFFEIPKDIDFDSPD